MLALALAALVAGAAPGPDLPPSVRWGRPPASWVDLSPPQTSTSTAPDGPRAGTRTRLLDDQLQVVQGHPTHFVRWVRVVLDADGLEHAGELRLEWVPDWETLDVHWVRVRRGDRVLEPVRARDVRVLQRERRLDQGLVDDEHTLVIFVPGLEVGDEVEVASTHRGANPALGGRFADRYGLAWRGWHNDERRLRVLWQGPRTLFVRTLGGAPPPQVTTRGRQTEYRWSWTERLPDREPRVPRWHIDEPMVQLSDFESWADVSRWNMSAYAVPTELPEAMQDWLSEQRDAPEEARFLAATAFVQGKVRYLGVEAGENAVRPHPPEQVFAQRYGDCKDKALLLVTLLTHLGIEARAALVQADWTRGLDALHPSPFAFDHVVVRAEVGGEERWVDATMAEQTGPFRSWTALSRTQALLLAPETEGLVVREPPVFETPDIEVHETFDIDVGGHDIIVTVDTTLRRGRAQRMRAQLAREGAEEVQSSYLEFEQSRFPKASVEAPLQVELEADHVKLREVYRLPNQELRDTATDAWAVLEELEPVEVDAEREAPLALPGRVHVVHVVEILPKGRIRSDQEHEVIEAPGLRFVYDEHTRGERGYHRSELWRDADHIAASDVAAYADAVERARRLASIYYTWRDEPTGDAGDAVVGVFAVLLGVVIMGAVGLFFYKLSAADAESSTRPGRRARAFMRQHEAAKGETAQTPYRLASEDALETQLARHRCACGAKGGWTSEGEASSVRISGRTVRSQSIECGRCKALSHVYYVTEGA